MLYTGDMVSHRYNEQWQRGKIHSLPADEPNYALVLWANGDLEKVLTEDMIKRVVHEVEKKALEIEKK